MPWINEPIKFDTIKNHTQTNTDRGNAVQVMSMDVETLFEYDKALELAYIENKSRKPKNPTKGYGV